MYTAVCMLYVPPWMYHTPTKVSLSCIIYYMYVVWSSHVIARKSKGRPGKVTNPSRGELNGENYFTLSPFAPENLVFRDGFGSPSRVVSLPISILRLNMVLTYYGIPPDFRGGVQFLFQLPYAIESVPSLSGRVIAYR